MLSSRVSLAAMGSLKKLPSYSDIELGLLDKEVRNCPPPRPPPSYQVELTYFHTLKSEILWIRTRPFKSFRISIQLLIRPVNEAK
jgi:hypothetical protein